MVRRRIAAEPPGAELPFNVRSFKPEHVRNVYSCYGHFTSKCGRFRLRRLRARLAVRHGSREPWCNSSAFDPHQMSTHQKSNVAISVIVPENPFVPSDLKKIHMCLAALDVEKLMQWWPGDPHQPHRNADKVKSIQRSLNWKQVCQIAAYLLQKEIVEAPSKLDEYFGEIYEPTKHEPGREWPPKVTRVVKAEPSEFPTFSNVLLHVNGATLEQLVNGADGAAQLMFDESDKDLNVSVIDGQHRINGAYFAIKLLQEETPKAKWQIPAEVFLDLDPADQPPRRQAQIFIDVNSHQKKVDRSLVADLFPTARSHRRALNDKERAQDLGRILMLEKGPLVGMVQIPGIKYGRKDVVALATLNVAIEDLLPHLEKCGITTLHEQADVIAQALESWLLATGRKQELEDEEELDADNVAYQGRVIVSFLTLVPACVWKLSKASKPLLSELSVDYLASWLKSTMKKAGLLENDKFIGKAKFKAKKFLGSGGVALFRDTLWAAALSAKSVSRFRAEKLAAIAKDHRHKVYEALAERQA
jgi:DGQHR domain-containing protein